MINTSRRALLAAATALGVAVSLAPAAQASVPDTPDATAQAVGGVYALAKAGDRTILGGTFTRFGGIARANVAAALPDGTVDRTFNPGTNGVVRAVAVSEDGSTVFLGGLFTTVGGQPRANLAAVDAVTGEALASWRADTAGAYPDVNSLAVDGNRLYVGGRYTGIDGTTRKRLVAVDVTTGQVITGFNPAPNGNVREVVVSPDGTKVYAGGAFGKIGGQDRLTHAAELLATTGAATSFNPGSPNASGNVVTIEISPDGSRFFYTTENNVLLAFDPPSNTPAWTRKFSGNIQVMAASSSGELYLGGHFVQDVATKAKRPYFASVRWADGQLTPWAPAATGGKLGTWALLLDGNRLHSGGFFRYFGGIQQRGYARFTGTP